MILHRIFHRAALAALCALALPASARAAVIVGSGSDFSYLVIEATQFGAPLEYEFHYSYNINSPLDTYDLITAIDVADSNLSFSLVNYGSPESPNYFISSITYNSITLENADVFWAQWVGGGTSGYPTESNVASGSWSEGSGLSYRSLAPGSWDGLIYNGEFNPDPPYNMTSAQPSVAPVPEPATIALLALGGLALLARRRSRHAR